MSTHSDPKRHRDNRAETLRRKKIRQTRTSESQRQSRVIRYWETSNR